MDKARILYVALDFYQAGAERSLYEVDRALDKNRFEPTILCLGKKAVVDSQWGKRHYEEKHRELGTEIEFIDRFLRKEHVMNKVSDKLRQKFFKISKHHIKPGLNQYLEQFDLIHWIGEYTFFHGISDANLAKSIVHTMSARFQNPDLYARFDLGRAYNLISGFDPEECRYEFEGFRHMRHWRIPLVLKVPFTENKWAFRSTEILKIGIFTRLSRYKPLDPFFYSFQLLLEKLPQCELHVYGNGDPEKEGMNHYLETLGIKEKVFFRGHQENIVETALNEHIGLSWFQGYNNDRPAGYAGFDICSTGTPLICWDFLEKPTKAFNETYPHYKKLTAFVEKSLEILTQPKSANALSALQFKDVLENRNVATKIRSIENIYDEILKGNP